MTDDKTPHPELEGRNKDGTFAEGNELGGPAVTGYTPFNKRADQLDAKYDSVDKLAALFVKNPETGRMEPGPELRAMHPRDAAIIMQTMGAVFGDDKRGERESYYDRREGKPIQRSEFSGPNGGAIEVADANQARDILLHGRGVPGAAGSGTASTPGDAVQPAADKPPV